MSHNTPTAARMADQLVSDLLGVKALAPEYYEKGNEQLDALRSTIFNSIIARLPFQAPAPALEPVPPKKLAKRIVQAVLDDLLDRSGFDHWWEGELDDDTQREARQTMRLAVMEELLDHADQLPAREEKSKKKQSRLAEGIVAGFITVSGDDEGFSEWWDNLSGGKQARIREELLTNVLFHLNGKKHEGE